MMKKNTILSRRFDRAFTLIELLMVLVIIGILISLLLPAVQAAREAARRAQCAATLLQVGLAAKAYEENHGMLPPGSSNPKGPIRNVPIGDHMGWLPRILPYLEMTQVYQHIDFSQSVYAEVNQPVWLGIDKSLQFSPLRFCCPSAPYTRSTFVNSNYVGCHSGTETPIDVDNNGVFFLNSKVRSRDIPDGTSNTIYFGETIILDPKRYNSQSIQNGKIGYRTVVPPDGVKEFRACVMGWMTGTGATLRNTQSSLGTISGPYALDARFDQMISGYRMPIPGANPNGPSGEVPKNLKPLVIPHDKWKTPHPIELHVGGFGSYHGAHGANFSMGDGSLRFISEMIDLTVFQALGNRRDSAK